MTLISVRDGPSLPHRLAHLAGQALVKRGAAPVTSYSLAGVLYLSQSGWLLLSVPNSLARGVFAAMHEPGIELPPSEHGQAFNAHVSIMTPDELERLGGPDKVSERGKQFYYTLGRLKEVEPDGWANVAKAWYVTIHSTELQTLRRSYGLSSLPHGGEYDFHLTVAVRRRGVLGKNDSSKDS